jgi:lipopolysaccharide exporter
MVPEMSGNEQPSGRGGIRRFIGRFFTPGESLSRKMVHGSIWVFSLRIANQMVRLFRTLLLARILGPHDYGIFGVALLAMGVLEAFSQTGFQQALIQRRDNITPYLDTAWTTQAIRGCMLALALALCAPAVAAFYEQPEATSILRVIGLCYLFQGFTNIGVLYFQKDLEFHRQFLYLFSGTLLDLAVAIVSVSFLANAWALVLATMAGDFARMVVSYAVHPYRPRLRWEWAKVRELSRFGRWIMGENVMSFVLNTGPTAAAGKILDVAALGLYSLAYRISNLPATEITHVISQVSFPAYVKIQDDAEKMRSTYLKVLQLTAFISVPIAGLIFAFTPDFTRLFLKEKWLAMVPAMQFLALWGLVRSIGATVGPVYRAVGRPWITAQLILFQVVITAALVYPLTVRWELLGTAAAVLLAALLPHIVGVWVVIRITGCGLREYLRPVWYPLVATAPAVGLVLARQHAWSRPMGVVEFFLLAAAAAAVYGAVCYALDRYFNYGIGATLKKSFALI